MTQDPTLFDPPRARHTDPQTAHRAARSVSGVGLEESILVVFRGPLAGSEGLTDDDVCAMLPDRYPPSVKSARSRLTKAGLLVDSGRRRASNRGAEMIVWSRP